MSATTPQKGQDWKDPLFGMPFVWLEALEMWVAKYQVTNGEFAAFRPEHDSGDYEGQPLNGDRQPAVGLSYEDAMAYCEWLTGQLTEAGHLTDEFIIRLPSHVEWTAFARCGDGRVYPWGDDWPPTFGNYGDEAAKRVFPDWEPISGYDDGYAVTCPVEEAGENSWGLVGVGGNAYEWTFEAEGTSCELRGGSFSTNQAEYLKIDNRYRREASGHLVNFGCRVVLIY